MRRLTNLSLIALLSATLPLAAHGQSPLVATPSLAGTQELGVFASGRILSTDYSAEQGKAAFGGAVTFGTHLRSMLAVQGGIAANYSRQEYSYYKPPLLTFTPTVSLILQRSTTEAFQPYALVGGGYEFIRLTRARCDCDQSKSLGVANVGLGFRQMVGGRRAVRFEVTSQIGQGGPAFTALMGMSVFRGTRSQFAGQGRMRPPGRVRTEPPLVPVPKQTTTVRPATTPDKPTPAPVNNPTPANSVTRAASASPLPTGVGAVLLQIDGTQVDFSKPAWRSEAESMLDGLVVELVSDAGRNIKLSIEAHTDNIGSNAANIMIGLDRAGSVRDYLVTQGVVSSRIRLASSGEDTPIAPNTTAIGRQQNRRIIIKRDN